MSDNNKPIQYEVLRGVSIGKKRWKVGDTASATELKNIKWLLDIGAIVPAKKGDG